MNFRLSTGAIRAAEKILVRGKDVHIKRTPSGTKVLELNEKVEFFDEKPEKSLE